uniref:Reverse transcriptase domain-containing protein n=1 Tax=Cannabis sativa TaxID=3483 RepID=A0A803PLQ3_CANSA
MEKHYANIVLEDEDDGVEFNNIEAEEVMVDDRLYLVGQFLNARVLDFDAMGHTMVGTVVDAQFDEGRLETYGGVLVGRSGDRGGGVMDGGNPMNHGKDNHGIRMEHAANFLLGRGVDTKRRKPNTCEDFGDGLHDMEEDIEDSDVISENNGLMPNALCNLLYKVYFKVLVNRLKTILPLVISENQSAFIPGRLITDNIMISFEVMHYLKWKGVGKEGYMALKLDMSKAYDCVEWYFLCNMMRKMGFHERIVDLILQCIYSVSYIITHGGREVGPILPGRGIHQGDPLSPYLFLICAEGFSSLIKRFEACGDLHGCHVCNGAPTISHILFADDCYLYCKANDTEASNVIRLLQVFEEASGQCVNFTRFTIFFSMNTTAATKDRMCTLLGMMDAPADSLYLRLPCTMSHNKNAISGFLKDKMQKCIQSWKGHLLSKVGKEVLQKTVVQALPTYAMSVFLFPVEMCNKLEGMMRINDLFNERDRKLIFSVPVSLTAACDYWFWALNISGLYQVKDAYKFLHKNDHLLVLPSDLDMWKIVWKLAVPPKVLQFLWPALSNVLPTKSQLSFALVREEATMVGWAIWNAIYDMDWQRFTTEEALTGTSSRRRSQVPMGMNVGSEHWSKPAFNNVKVNVDGAIFASEGWFGFGSVARDHNGRVIESISQSKPRQVDATMAEIYGIKEALSWIKRKGWVDVQLETHCLVAVKALQSTIHMPSPFGLLVRECKIYLTSLKSVEIYFIKRSVNKVAHCLARSSYFYLDRIFTKTPSPVEHCRRIYFNSFHGTKTFSSPPSMHCVNLGRSKFFSVFIYLKVGGEMGYTITQHSFMIGGHSLHRFSKQDGLCCGTGRSSSIKECAVYINCFSSSRDFSRKPFRSPKVSIETTRGGGPLLHRYGYKEIHLLKVLNRACRAGKYKEALYFLQLMVTKGFKPDVILCTKVMRGFFSSRDVQNAVRVMEILEKHGEPDLFSYNAMISGFCKANRIELANRVLDRMRAQGFSPDTITYNIMIGSLCSRGRLELAFNVLDELLKDKCAPSVITYTILIEATISEGGIDKAMELLDEMLSRGLLPDMCTFNAIIRGMCREGMVDRAFEFVRSLEAKGCSPDVISYNILLRALLNHGKWNDGEKLLSDMVSRGCEPNVVTYSILISTLCKDGKVEDAVNVLKAMKEKGITPDAYSYDPLISAFCKDGRLDLAIEFMDYMISDGSLPDIVNYNTILSAFCKNGNPEQALDIFHKLGEVGCPPNVSSYNTMFSALWNCGERVKALEMISEMVSKGIDPDEITYNSLISCLCRDGLVNEAIGLLLDMDSGGFRPSVISYNIVLLGLCKARRIDDAIEFFTTMVGKGCQPNETTLILLVEGIGFAGWRVEAMGLANSLLKLEAISEHSFKRLNKIFPMLDVYKELTLSEIKN